ncbi:zinc finger MYND domain-containing protein 10 [Lepeophtheirus salmonis]|uniref:zinc finger MYND domain-containing protein 10 n=1 Tax=Lepeophtheirus salmonis TaxID=72036 RepID=UPI001AEA0749|nr:zinc finger MYND domain-containing protein 10-like [Lepeophtheirus salmonis]
MEKGIFESSTEIEIAINGYNGTQDLESIGSAFWLKSVAKTLESLNVQAAIEANAGIEEFVRDSLTEKNKLPIFVKDLILVELWKERVLPIILKESDLKTSFSIYMILFFEANVSNLLETVLFDGASATSLDDSVVDLTDYIMRQLTKFVLLANDNRDEGALTEEREIHRQRRELDFQIGIKCISIMYYLCEHIEDISIGVSSRLVINHDAPALCIELLRCKPWERIQKGGQTSYYDGNDWRKKDDDSKISNSEVLLWTSLWYLLQKIPFREKYEIHSFRKNQLLSLLPLINHDLKICLPLLSDFEQALHTLEISHWSNTNKHNNNALLVEQVAEIREDILSFYEGKYVSIAMDQIKNHVEENKQSVLLEESSFILDILNNEAVQELMTGSQSKSCVVCRKPSSRNLCSVCKSVRYCGRECQAKHWPAHKKSCSLEKSKEKIQVLS